MASSPVAIIPSDSKLVWRKMNKQELRDALASRGLDTSGLRHSLIQRLESFCKSATADITETSFKSSSEERHLSATTPQNGTVDHTDTQTQTDVRKFSETEELNLVTEDVLDMSEKSLASNQARDANVDRGKHDSNGSAASSMVVSSQAKNAHVDNRKCELNGSGASSIASLSDLDKKRKRAERFGVVLNVSDEEKLAIRSQRFASGQKENNANIQDLESEKRKQRAARFGIVNEATKKTARQERFGVSKEQIESEYAKRKARAERFEATSKHENHKGKDS